MSEVFELKTGRFLELVEHKTKPLHGESASLSIQIRLRKDRDVAAYVEYKPGWKCWVWEPRSGFEHSASCTREIASFLEYLDKDRPNGLVVHKEAMA